MSVTLDVCEDQPDYSPNDAVEIANSFTQAVNEWEQRAERTPALSTSIAAAILWMLRCMEAQFPDEQ